MLTHGSLCTGYGGLDDAVSRVFDSRLTWWSDIDPGSIAVMEHHAPGVPNIGDLKTAEWHDVLDTYGPIDILTAGYPCQPFSNAGKRLGTDDPRHLWPYISYAVGVLRPRLIVLENVAAHLKRGFDVVLADLAALGYDAAWTVVRASDIGAPHRRDRLFVVAAHPACEREHRGGASGTLGRPEPADGGDSVADADGGQRDGRQQQDPQRSAEQRAAAAGRGGGGGDRPAVADATGDGRHEWRPEPAGQFRGPDAAERGTQAAADAGSERLEVRSVQSARYECQTTERGSGEQAFDDWWHTRYFGLGTEDAAADTSRERHGRWQDGGAVGLLDGRDAEEASERERARQEPGDQGAADSTERWGPYRTAIEHWERILGRPAPSPIEPGVRKGSVLSPAFVEWMMGLEPGHVTGVPDLTRNLRLKLLGNGVVPQQAEHAIRTLLPRLFGDFGQITSPSRNV